MENKETIEEAATKEGLLRCSQHNYNQAEAGYNAKWFKRGAIFGAKWQSERMYSEEEVNEIIVETWLSVEDNEGDETFSQARERILEQFKKTKDGK